MKRAFLCLLSIFTCLHAATVFQVPDLNKEEKVRYKEFIHVLGDSVDEYRKKIALNSEYELCKAIDIIKDKFTLTRAVETGTYYGSTTLFFSTIFDQVDTFDVSNEYLAIAKPRFAERENISVYNESSGTGIQKLLKSIDLENERVFFYLDAHWGRYWPLRDEINQIARHLKDNCIIMIDDIKVPGWPKIGYDKYGRMECSYEYVKDLMKDLFTSHKVYYFITNKEHRGKLLLVPDSYLDGKELTIEDFQ